MYYYGKHYNTKDELIKAIDDWIHYYMYERYQRRFGVKTPYEVRRDCLLYTSFCFYRIIYKHMKTTVINTVKRKSR